MTKLQFIQIGNGDMTANGRSGVAHIDTCKLHRPYYPAIKYGNGVTLKNLCIMNGELYAQLLQKDNGKVNRNTIAISTKQIPNLCLHCERRILAYLDFAKEQMIKASRIYGLHGNEAVRVIKYANRNNWNVHFSEGYLSAQVTDYALNELRKFMNTSKFSYRIEKADDAPENEPTISDTIIKDVQSNIGLTKEQFAAMLDGRQWGEELSGYDDITAASSRLVVCICVSDTPLTT